MNADVIDRIDALGPATLSAIEVSGTFYREAGWAQYRSVAFPEFDLCAPDAVTLRDRYDVVICDQVIEHVRDPRVAITTLRSMAKPGGWLIVGTPFLIRIHPAPEDHWRFTPSGMELLLQGAGLEGIEVRSWGNRRCVRANFRRWAPYRFWRSTRNEPDFPATVWAFARVPSSETPGASTAPQGSALATTPRETRE